MNHYELFSHSQTSLFCSPFRASLQPAIRLLQTRHPAENPALCRWLKAQSRERCYNKLRSPGYHPPESRGVCKHILYKRNTNPPNAQKAFLQECRLQKLLYIAYFANYPQVAYFCGLSFTEPDIVNIRHIARV